MLLNPVPLVEVLLPLGVPSSLSPIDDELETMNASSPSLCSVPPLGALVPIGALLPLVAVSSLMGGISRSLER